jgi:hypothetical protein
MSLISALKERLKGRSRVTIAEAYKDVFLTEKGRLVLDHLCHECGIDHVSFSDIPTRMAFEEGKRSVALSILRILNIKPITQITPTAEKED